MKKILPPVLFIVFIVVMVVTSWLMDSLHTVNYTYNLLGIFGVAIGLFISIKGKALFKTLGTNIMTFDNPDKLVTEGIYQYSRNPMYLGFVVALLGFALLTGASIVSFLFVVLFFLITDRWYIAFEEKAMMKTFGGEYKAYCQTVRRWI